MDAPTDISNKRFLTLCRCRLARARVVDEKLSSPQGFITILVPNHSNFNILWLLLKIWILGSENSNSGFRHKNGTMWFLTFFLIRGWKVKNFGILGHVCSGRIFDFKHLCPKTCKNWLKMPIYFLALKRTPKWPVWLAFESLTSKNVKISSPSLQNTKILPKMWNLGLFLATEKHGKNPRSHNTEVWDCYVQNRTKDNKVTIK